jgi:hypothetical protein
VFSRAGAASNGHLGNVRRRTAGPLGRRSGRRICLLAICASWLVGCSSATTTAPTPTAAASSPAATLGVYPGPADTRGFRYFERRLGHSAGMAHDYLDKTTWAAIENVDWLGESWGAAGYGSRMVLSVPVLPNTGGTLAKGAKGRYNAHFRNLARNLVRGKLGSAVLRLGHEFNGTWFRWRIDRPKGAKNFAAYWRQIVNTMNSVPGAHFKYDWCPNAGSAYVGRGKQLNAASAWPGDTYVDYVGMDVFDQSWGTKDPVKRWREIVDQHDGLAWQAAFAAKHGKPITFPEWGLVDRMDGRGGGDDPYFIRQMYDWIQSHDVAYHVYFENEDPNADYGVFSGWFPNAANTFIDLFGSRAGVAKTIGLNDQAQLQIAGAQIKDGKRFDALAQFSRRASGKARVQIQAGGRKIRFTTMLRGGTGSAQINRVLSGTIGRAASGMVTFAYGGDDDSHPQLVRLRAGPRSPRFAASPPVIAGGRLAVKGQLDRAARGTVLVQLRYVVDAQIVTRSFSTRVVGAGRWSLNSPLGDIIQAELNRRWGPVTAAVLYPGYAPRGIRGDLRSYQVLGRR